MRKVTPPIYRFYPEMWSSDRRLVLFVCQDGNARWSFCVTRTTLESLCYGAEPEQAFERCRSAIYRAATLCMLRGRPPARSRVLSAQDIGDAG
jgi:hypothetical protein